MFEGVSVAVVTPFRNGAVDEAAFRALVDRLFGMGLDGVVVGGSTGEAATLSREERRRIVTAAVAEAKGRGFVVAGTGTNDTAGSIELSRDAKAAGVDGLMIVTPYYNKPSPAGLEAHYRAISEAASLPILAYNVPGRTGYNLPPAMAARLARIPGVVALKEASGSVDQGLDVMAAAPGLTFLSGEDSLTLPLVAAGAKGVVSVAGHLIGDTIKAMIDAHERGEVDEARRLNRTVVAVTRAMFLESNPGPVKYAMSRLGWMANELRPPLAPVTPETAVQIDAVLEPLAAGISRAG
jgi:4-hydroxy-tetrahydrodipicolinate synthase